MGIIRFEAVTEVCIFIRIFASYDIDRPTKGRPTEAGRYHSLIDLDTVNHIHRNIVVVNIICLIGHRYFVYKKTDALTLQATDRKARATAYPSRGTQGNPYGLDQYILYTADGTSHIGQVNHRNRHGFFFLLVSNGLGCNHYLSDFLLLRGKCYILLSISTNSNFFTNTLIAKIIEAYGVASLRYRQ